MLDFFRLRRLEDEKAGSLSYGQQKLLDAAMAFMSGSRLVLLYEPLKNHSDPTGGNIAYADGHAVWRNQQSLESDLEAMHRRQELIPGSSHYR